MKINKKQLAINDAYHTHKNSIFLNKMQFKKNIKILFKQYYI